MSVFVIIHPQFMEVSPCFEESLYCNGRLWFWFVQRLEQKEEQEQMNRDQFLQRKEETQKPFLKKKTSSVFDITIELETFAHELEWIHSAIREPAKS